MPIAPCTFWLAILTHKVGMKLICFLVLDRKSLCAAIYAVLVVPKLKFTF